MPKLAYASPARFNEDASVLRFEESDDFSTYPAKPGQAARISPDETEDDPYGSLSTKQQELLRLRHELEKKEREATEFAARREKEERFATGRREMCERLTRTITRLDRELHDAKRAIEEINVARSDFMRHLDILRAQQPEAWQRGNLDVELDQAIASIEDADDDYSKTIRRLGAVLPDDIDGASDESAGGVSAFPEDFGSNLRMGFAFTLPLATIIVIAIVLTRIFIH